MAIEDDLIDILPSIAKNLIVLIGILLEMADSRKANFNWLFSEYNLTGVVQCKK